MQSRVDYLKSRQLLKEALYLCESKSYEDILFKSDYELVGKHYELFIYQINPFTNGMPIGVF